MGCSRGDRGHFPQHLEARTKPEPRGSLHIGAFYFSCRKFYLCFSQQKTRTNDVNISSFFFRKRSVQMLDYGVDPNHVAPSNIRTHLSRPCDAPRQTACLPIDRFSLMDVDTWCTQQNIGVSHLCATDLIGFIPLANSAWLTLIYDASSSSRTHPSSSVAAAESGVRPSVDSARLTLIPGTSSNCRMHVSRPLRATA